MNIHEWYFYQYIQELRICGLKRYVHIFGVKIVGVDFTKHHVNSVNKNK